MNTMPKEPNLIHRDDLPMDVAEGMIEAIKKEVGKEAGDDFKVVFAGDLPEGKQTEVIEQFKEIERAMDRAFFNGFCWDCGKRIPKIWTPWKDKEGDYYKLSDGWSIISSIPEDGPLMLQCPECGEIEEATQGISQKVEVPKNMDVGTRVGAFLFMSDTELLVLGYGTYDGDEETPPKDVTDFGMPNPKITLDSGKVVWGCECWWGPEEEYKEQEAKHINAKVVDIDEVRK